MCDARAVRKLIVMAAFAALFPACRASVNINAQAATQQPEEELSAAPSAPVQELTAQPPPANTEYFGVARGLALAPGQPAACSCVAASVGYPGNQEFQWRGVPPSVGQDALVIAIGSEGVACDKPGHGPSIRAIDRDGDDVIVVLEDWHQARPQALGAIIPNPGANGRVYLRAHGKSPYGAPLTAVAGPRGNLCKIGQGAGDANTTVTPAANQEPEEKTSAP
jgi:hypothetical protein